MFCILCLFQWETVRGCQCRVKDKDSNVKEILCCESCFCCSGADYLVGGLWRGAAGGDPMFPAKPFSSYRMVLWVPLGLPKQPRGSGLCRFHLAWLPKTLSEKDWGNILLLHIGKARPSSIINRLNTLSVTKNMTLCSFLKAFLSKAQSRPYLF